MDEKAHWYALEHKIKKYLEYVDGNEWVEYIKDPLPSFLLICPHERFKKKIHYLINELLTKGKFYVSTKEQIISSGYKSDLWERVKVKDL